MAAMELRSLPPGRVNNLFGVRAESPRDPWRLQLVRGNPTSSQALSIWLGCRLALSAREALTERGG